MIRALEAGEGTAPSAALLREIQATNQWTRLIEKGLKEVSRFNRVMLYRKIMIICSYNHSKYMNVLCVCVGGGEKIWIKNIKEKGKKN